MSLSLRKTFSTTPYTFARAKKKQLFRNHQERYAFDQVKQRREANISRQAVLKQQREKARGDPIRGITTPFVESFDTLLLPAESDGKIEAAKPFQPPPIPAYIMEGKHRKFLNNFITQDLLEKSLEYSRQLTEPIISTTPDVMRDPEEEAEAIKSYQSHHENATRALNAIVSLQNCNGKDRTRINMQRIIDTFGRHNTDLYLKPKAPPPIHLNPSTPRPQPTPRAGPDVGSSEVQIGILTAKIRVLADRYEGRESKPNRKDKANKRNLRLLLHRRQKLLKYMVRRERGSERWHNMIQTLGLTEATWKGQIEVR